MNSGYVIEQQIKGKKVQLITYQRYLKTYKQQENQNLFEVLMGLKNKNFSNIVKIYDVVFDEKKGEILVYEEVCKHDLRKMMKNDPNQFNIQEILKCLSDVIQGLLELKSLNIFHRDIKPDNIVHDGTNYKIIDFDRAKVNVNGEIRIHSLQIGTKGYQAPEIINNQPYSYQCDVWSLGCVFHYLLFGNDPKISNDEVFIPPKHQYDDQVIKLLHKMLDMNQRKRIMLEDLKKEVKNLQQNLNNSDTSTRLEQNTKSQFLGQNQPDEENKFNTIMEQLIDKEQNLQKKIYLYQFWVQRLEKKFPESMDQRKKVTEQQLKTIVEGQQNKVKFNLFYSLDQIKSQLKCFTKLQQFYDF
ncbi:unnamed protein product [Paramecium octaurelia]|uniref:Protein kinase domain-containing protein n=1 Tax=Paramecium octaurelia TaxID=43137 RepID=A0A8S1SLL7_PAROT|nr:unnamed protein product [Paramecium octaurelia]